MKPNHARPIPALDAAWIHARLAEACDACRKQPASEAYDYARAFQHIHLHPPKPTPPMVRARFASQTGHAAFSEGCQKCWRENDHNEGREYALRYVVKHLQAARSWDALQTTLCDLEFIEAECVAGITNEL